MYALHTTPALVLGSFPVAESSRTYRLLTRDLGLVYARAQSVRELKNRNRFALQNGTLTTVTLVRGREVWRVTTTRLEDEARAPLPLRRVFELTHKLTPIEDRTIDVFTPLWSALSARESVPHEILEPITALRVLSALGYVARPFNNDHVERYLASNDFSDALLRCFPGDRVHVFRAINNALRAAHT